METLIEFLRKLNDDSTILGLTLMSLATIGGAVTTLLVGPKKVITWICNFITHTNIKKKNKEFQDENISVYPIGTILSHPELIMGDSGLTNHGYNPNIYITREIDDTIRQSIGQKPCTIIIGRAGSGKSRAIYQYLLSQKHDFERVVVIQRKSLTCNMQQLQTFLRPYIRKQAHALIYIDDFHKVKDIDRNAGWNQWESIIEDVQKSLGTIVFVSRDKEDFEYEESIEITPIIRNSATHQQCIERFQSTFFSPIIGNYIERERVEDVINIPSEALLISTHNFITHYFHRRGTQEDYLKKVYNRLCERLAADLGRDEAENLKVHFNSALNALKEKGILGTTCKLTDELFISDLTDCLYNKKYDYNNNNIVPEDAIIYTCSLLTSSRSSLSYIQEKELVKILLSIDENDIEPYVRAITRATGQNTRRITKFVQAKFEENYVGQEDKTSMDKITQMISIIASRTFYDWKNIVNAYLKKYSSLNVSNDLISEILRIATDDRTSQEEKQKAIDYIHHTLQISAEDLCDRATKDTRIALNYERAQLDIDGNRIAKVLLLLLANLSKCNDNFHDAISDAKREDIKNDIHYALRDIVAWTRTVSAKVSSYQQLENLVNILRSHSRALMSLQEKIKAAPQNELEHFTFLSYSSLWGIAHNIHKAYPIGYDKQYTKCIDLLSALAQKEKYIVDKSGFVGFMLSKPRISGKKTQRGALAELKTFNQVCSCITTATKHSIIGKEDTYTYIAWLYRLFSVIKTTEDFEIADTMLTNFLSADSENKISTEGKRKLYNYLLSNAPWEKAKIMVTKERFLYKECDSYTISSLFKAARNSFYTLSKNIYLQDNSIAKIQSAIKIAEILETIHQFAQLSRSRNLKWDSSAGTLLKNIQSRLMQCIKQKEAESAINPKLRDYVIAKHGQAVLYINALDELIREIEEERTRSAIRNKTTITLDFASTQDWSNLSVSETKEILMDIKEYFFEGVLNETGRALTSDKMTHLIKHINDLVKNTKNESKKDKWNFEGEEEQEIALLLEDLLYNGRDCNPDETLDAYIPIKFYYYTQVGEFLIYFVKPALKERLQFGLNALHRLNECGSPISENKEEAHNAVNEKNIFEILLADLSFDECVSMIDEVKKIAQVEIYKNVYTAKSIVILCNKLKEGLQYNDESKTLLIRRINQVNRLISDETQLEKTGNVLFFDADDAPKIASINSNLTKQNKHHHDEIFFPELSKNIKINLPIASANARIRHAAWSMYEDQDCLYNIKTKALNLFLYRELEEICATIASAIKYSPDLLEYYRKAMNLLHDETYLNKMSSSNQSIEEITKNHAKLLQKYNLKDKMTLLNTNPWILI